MNNAIEYSSKGISAEDLISLHKDAKWAIPDPDSAKISLSNTVFSIAALQDGQLIGYGRILGDHSLFYCISDVIILKQFQKQRIGTEIMNRLMEFIKKDAKAGAFIGLFSARNLEPFYEKYGFENRPSPSRGAGMSYTVQRKITEAK